MKSQIHKYCLAVILAFTPMLFAQNAIADSDNTKVNRSYSYKYASKASLRASAAQEVQQDKLKIILTLELEESTQQDVSTQLAKQLNQAMQLAKEKNNDNVKISSGAYQVWAMSNKIGKITNWRGKAELYLESSDFTAASEIASSLNEYMAVSSLRFFVSQERRAQVEEQLLEEATRAFDTRAIALTKALGFKNYRIDNVDLGGSGALYSESSQLRMMSAVPMADSIPLESSTESISLGISGTIYLLND